MKIRTTKPGAGNKYYIRDDNGGYSPCITGKPTDKDCNVLSNCVGYALGRFNEESNEKKIKFLGSMNAENFFANAHRWNLKTGQEPKQGAMMCWAKGKAGVASDGAGHVCIVEKVNSTTQVFTSESAWNGTAFYNKTRNKGSNRNWGAGSKYTFLGFIYNPNIKEEIIPAPIPYEGVSDEELARRVWLGEFGNGDDRKKALGSRYSAVQSLVNAGVGKPVPKPTGFKRGEIVVPTRLVSYTGSRLVQYDKQYVVYEDSRNDRVILAAPRHGKLVIWAAMNIKDVRRK